MARATSRLATPGDMVRSLLVLLVPVIAITYFFTRTPDAPQVPSVDWVPVLSQARSQAPFEVLAPRAVPSDWRPTRASWVAEGKPYLNGDPSPRNLWQLGFLTSDEVYLELDQGDRELPQLLADKTRDGLPDGQSELGGRTWQRLVSEDERTRSLVLASADVTTIVSGDLSYAELESFATTLAED